MEWLASTDAHIENTLATETREDWSIYNNPLVQMPLADDPPFLFLMEGQAGSSNWMFNHPPDETIEVEYGPNSPFWRTSLGKSIAEYITTTTKPEPFILSPLRQLIHRNPSNEYFFWESIEHLCQSAENLRRRIISPLPSPSRKSPPAYHSLSPPQVSLLPESPTQNLVTQNLGQTSTPTPHSQNSP